MFLFLPQNNPRAALGLFYLLSLRSISFLLAVPPQQSRYVYVFPQSYQGMYHAKLQCGWFMAGPFLPFFFGGAGRAESNLLHV